MTITIEDVLAARYATEEMKDIWSTRGKIISERRFWIEVMKAQRDSGADIPEEAIQDYLAVVEEVNLDSINQREKVTRHDVKARIEEFCELAGHQYIHLGMTSRDLTDNVEQMQILSSLELIQARFLSLMVLLAEKADEHRDLVITGRTHMQAAQATTVGKRLATFGDEMLYAYAALDDLICRYPLRGMKGAIGTSQDMLDVLGGNGASLEQLEGGLIQFLGFDETFISVGQVYPRSLDYDVMSTLALLAAGPSNLATTLRLMSGSSLATEGFAPGQVGSSAMPHKMNPRTCERINGLNKILHGQVDMISRLSGDQWYEGDVSCSVVRRVGLPSAFFAIDGLVESAFDVLSKIGFYPIMIEQELAYFLPFLSTTAFLMAATRSGGERETFHEVIKEHATAVEVLRRDGQATPLDLIPRLARDQRFPLGAEEMMAIMEKVRTNTGNAGYQVDSFCSMIEDISRQHPDRVGYKGASII